MDIKEKSKILKETNFPVKVTCKVNYTDGNKGKDFIYGFIKQVSDDGVLLDSTIQLGVMIKIEWEVIEKIEQYISKVNIR